MATPRKSAQNSAPITPAPAAPLAPLPPDRWSRPEYVDKNAPKARATLQRGATAQLTGLVLPAQDMGLAGWTHFDAEMITEYPYESGNSEPALFLPKPRLLVLSTTPKFAIDRAATKKNKRTVALGKWDPTVHADDKNITPARAYALLLVRDDNTLYHTNPIALVAKGAAMATFDTQLRKFWQELTAAHATAYGRPPLPKDARFHAMCVFCPTFAREKAGTEVVGFACKTVDFEHPTQANWPQYFLGGDDAQADFILESFGIAEPPAQNTPALPAIEAGDDDDFDY